MQEKASQESRGITMDGYELISTVKVFCNKESGLASEITLGAHFPIEAIPALIMCLERSIDSLKSHFTEKTGKNDTEEIIKALKDTYNVKTEKFEIEQSTTKTDN